MIIYLLNKLCVFQGLLMTLTYYFLYLQFPFFQNEKVNFFSLIFIFLIWFINLIMVHLESIINIFISIYILFYIITFPFVWVYKKIKNINKK